jgi:hypothetical protein
MYINAVVNIVMLQLYVQHDFHNVVFKTKHKYVSSGSVPCPVLILDAHLFGTNVAGMTAR